jgi:hypothetical protein
MASEDRYTIDFTETVRNKCPCDNCGYFDRCKYEELACRSFAKFVLDNYYYVTAVRYPSKETFNKVFHKKDDDVLKNFVRGNQDEDNSESN